MRISITIWLKQPFSDKKTVAYSVQILKKRYVREINPLKIILGVKLQSLPDDYWIDKCC